MNAKWIVLGALVAIGAAAMSGCGWNATVKKTIGKPAEVNVGISGTFPAAIRAMAMQTAAVTADTLYIDTTGWPGSSTGISRCVPSDGKVPLGIAATIGAFGLS
jgi:hypothetical protein